MESSIAPIRVLMVCMGNICRSPMAQGVLEDRLRAAGLTNRVEVDSAGTHAYHVGEPPDPRARETAARRGIDLSAQRARAVTRADFERFDHILAMDLDNERRLLRLCPPELSTRIELLLAHAREAPDGLEVPDPYYGGENGFERVFDLVEKAADGFVARLAGDRARA